MDKPDKAQFSAWLSEVNINTFECGSCEGVHFSDLQQLNGVAECRMFVEPEGLMISAELDIRLSAIMHLTADMNNLNINFPALKLFTDIVDEGAPQLVASGFFYLGAGISEQQFLLFVQATLASVREVIEECARLDYLAVSGDVQDHRALH